MGNQAPDVYLRQLEAESGLPGNWLDDILTTHLIDAKYLRQRDVRLPDGGPDFLAFYNTRSDRLLTLIENAMGIRSKAESRG